MKFIAALEKIRLRFPPKDLLLGCEKEKMKRHRHHSPPSIQQRWRGKVNVKTIKKEAKSHFDWQKPRKNTIGLDWIESKTKEDEE